MRLQMGDVLSDEISEWRVIGRPYTTAGGKNSHVRVQRVDKPGMTENDLGYFQSMADSRAARSVNPEVAGSSPVEPAIFSTRLRYTRDGRSRMRCPTLRIHCAISGSPASR